MVNYKQSKIYELRCNITNKIYYGSTTKHYLSQRLTEHKAQYKRYLKDKKQYYSSFEILKNDDYKIILVENFECNSKDELRAREQHYINNNDCINKHRAFITEEEKNDYKKTQSNNYYQDNKDKLKEQSKKYYEKYKENVEHRKKKYYEDNKHNIKQRQKKYNEDNKDIRKKYYQENKEKIKNTSRDRETRKKLFLSSFGYEKRVFSCNLLNIDLSCFE